MKLEVAVLCLFVAGCTGFTECPRYCTCTQSSFSGGRAKCSRLDPALQTFTPDVATLVLDGYTEERLPAKIFSRLGLTGLLTLSITNGSLRHINKDAFLGLDFLEDLDLSNNRLERLDPTTFEKSQLKRLSLNGNQNLALSQTLLKTFLNSQTIVELTLADCNISDPEDVKALAGLPNLEFLDLSNNRLKSLSDDMFSALINLEDIDLSNNLISHIDRDTFADIDELTSLNLRGNLINTLEGIEIPGLKDLDLSDCRFERLAASSLEGFPELSSLNLSGNPIMTIDMDTFMNVPGLKDLDLSYNKLRGPLNDLLFEFNKRLETLSFRGNTEIKYLTGFKGDFPHLYNYDISKCGLTSIGNDTFRGMSSIVSLNVSGNSLVHLEPKTFADLPNLVVLDLSSNVLHALNPKLFASNKELSKLYLSKNFFRHVSPLLFQPTPKLHHLDLSECRLTTLWNISEFFIMRNRNILTKLTYLNVSGNRLTRLHTHYFISLENLQKLDISNNPIECTPDFGHVMQWLIMKKVVPNKRTTEHSVGGLDLIENNVRWDEVLRSVCPPEFGSSGGSPLDTVSAIPVIDIGQRNPGDIEIPIIEESAMVWPMFLVWASIVSVVFALANVIGLLIYRSRRTYRALGNNPLDFPVRRPKGRPVYQKLYEECSIPTPVHETKKLHIVAVIGSAFTKNNSNV